VLVRNSRRTSHQCELTERWQMSISVDYFKVTHPKKNNPHRVHVMLNSEVVVTRKWISESPLTAL